MIAMAMEMRRVVTGHDENGKAVVVSDERLSAVSRGIGAGISACEMWSTDRMPVDNSAAADTSQRADFVKHYIDANYVGTGTGTTFRITEWAPGHARFTHRTETADWRRSAMAIYSDWVQWRDHDAASVWAAVKRSISVDATRRDPPI